MIEKVPLREVAQIAMGSAPPSSSYNETGQGYPMIAGAGDYGELHPKTKKWTTEPSRLTQVGDLIVCVRATVGDLNWADKEYCLGRGVAGMRAKEGKLDISYAAHFINAKKADLQKLGTGSTFLAIRRADLEEFEIPLPPLPEQRRIAAILDKAGAIRRKRQQAIRLTEDFLRSVFLDMFGDPVTNPKGWEVDAVGTYADSIVPGRDKPKSFTGNTPWVTTNDLIHLGTTNRPLEFKGLTQNEIEQVRARIVPKSALLMTCVGDLGVISISGEDMVINQQLHAFLPKNNISTPFLMYALSFQKNYMLKMATHTTLPYMNKTVCNSVPIIVPPFLEQRRFEEIYKMTHNLRHPFNKSNLECSTLFNSLVQRAFRGDL